MLKKTKPQRRTLSSALFLLLAFCLAMFGSSASVRPETSGNPGVGEILAKMTERNRRRDLNLKTYSVNRLYKVENKRFNLAGLTRATMIYVAPGEKEFVIHSAEGKGFIRKGVINRLIETEQKSAAPEEKAKTAITLENYEFQWLRQETLKNRSQFVLRAKPLHKDRLLFDGVIWVDAEDFVVTRIEARPAKRPSFWTRKVDFTHEYEKFGEFWLPVRNHSITHVFLFGVTTTDVEYSNYQINQPGQAEQAAEIRKRGEKLEIQIDAKDKQ